MHTNITGTLTLLEEAVAAGVKAFVFTSTTSAFGRALAPAPGEPAAWITEDVRPVPRNIYGATKVAAEDLCELVHRDHGLPCLILRTSRFFPEGDDRDDVRARLRRPQPEGQRAALPPRRHRGRRERAPPRARARARSCGFGRYIISATTPFAPRRPRRAARRRPRGRPPPRPGLRGRLRAARLADVRQHRARLRQRARARASSAGRPATTSRPRSARSRRARTRAARSRATSARRAITRFPPVPTRFGTNTPRRIADIGGMGPPPPTSAAATPETTPAPQESWRPRPGKLIGDVIVEQGFAPREAVEAAAVAGREEGKQLGQVLIERGQLTPEQLGQSVALRFNLEYVEILNHQLDAVAVSMVDGAVARRLEVLPIGFAEDGQLRVAMANPSNVLAIDDLAMMTGRSILPVVASREDILTAVGRVSSLEGAVLEAVQDEARADRRGAARAARVRRRRARPSSSCARSSPRRSSRARPTSTSTPSPAASRSASASTASCSTPRRCPSGWSARSSRA